MSDFRDVSQSDSWDYSAFVRTYALYLDERLEYRMQSRRGKRSAFGIEDEEEQNNQNNINNIDTNNNNNSQAIVVRAAPVREMTTEQIFSKTQHLQQLLERFLACRPTGFYPYPQNHIQTKIKSPLNSFVFSSFFSFYKLKGC